MVLQKAPQRAIVWGYYNTSSSSTLNKITLSLDNTPVTVSPGQLPNTWIAKLPPTLASNTSHRLQLSDDTNTTIILNDILFGDVWLCSGQSNMAFLLQNAFNGSTYVNNSINYPNLRVFTSFKNNSPHPLPEQPKVQESWKVSSPSAVTEVALRQQDQHANGMRQVQDDDWLVFSAVCYLYGVEIMKHTKYPVGLVNTNWGGTSVEFWSSKESLSPCNDKQTKSGGAYNGMITPLLNMTIYGAIWYQGESNVGDKIATFDSQGLPMLTYGCTFPNMISDWRNKFNEGSLGETSKSFYFGYVQIAPWIAAGYGPSNIRWAQSAGYGYVPNHKMPNVFNAIAIDLTDRTSPYGSVHIRDKYTVAQRLSAGGISIAYNDTDIYWQGPYVKDVQVVLNKKDDKDDEDDEDDEDDKDEHKNIIITFDNVGDGLDVRNTTTNEFEMCILDVINPGANCSLVEEMSKNNSISLGDWFVVNIENSTKNTITLIRSSGKETQPGQRQMIRYAWKSLPFEYKQAGVYANNLPMAPFVKVIE